MFRKITTLIIIFLAVIIQIAVLPNFFSSSVVPDIALVLTIIWTVREGFEKTLPKTIILGVLFDLINGWTIGISVITLILISFGISSFAKEFLMTQKTWRIFTLGLLVVLSSIAGDLILVMFGKFFNVSAIFRYLNYNGTFTILDPKIILRSVYNLLLFVFVYWPVNNLEKFMDRYVRGISQQEKRFLSR